MKLPRDLYGDVLAEHLVRRWDYVRVHQTGSHIVLRTATPTGQTVSIPAHTPLKLGTLVSVLRSIAGHKGVSRETLLEGLL